MRSIRYLDGALDDLRAIAEHYNAIDLDVALRVRSDIEGAIAYLQENPNIGRSVGAKGLRRKLSRRFGFKIAYRVRRDAVEILGVYRYQDRNA